MKNIITYSFERVGINTNIIFVNFIIFEKENK